MGYANMHHGDAALCKGEAVLSRWAACNVLAEKYLDVLMRN